MAIEQLVCEKCHRVMKVGDFYKSNNAEKYAETEGYIPTCKNCLCMHVDNWNPDTYKPLLEELDVPYIPDEWNKLLANYAQKAKTSRTAIVGRYVSKMRMTQFKNYRWKDNAFLQEKKEMEIRTTMAAQGFEQADIETAIMKGYVPTPEKPKDEEEIYAAAAEKYAPVDYGLTEEDRIYLRNKWGKTYKEEEWIQLEQLYNDFVNSYDIQTAGHRDTLKMLCKTSLKANQLLDIGDIDGYQKAQKAYDSLMKSGKFSAVQNKTESGDFVDSISELVAICEKEGFIPRYYVDEPKDRVDAVLRDMQNYTRSLIMEETNLGNMLEAALNQIQQDKEKEAKVSTEDDDEESRLNALEDSLFADVEEDTTLNDEDYEEYYDWQERMASSEEEEDNGS